MADLATATDILRAVLAKHVADSRAMEQPVCANMVGWTIVWPPRLHDGGDPVGSVVAVGARPRGDSSMQCADLAVILRDEADKDQHAMQIVEVICGGRHVSEPVRKGVERPG